MIAAMKRALDALLTLLKPTWDRRIHDLIAEIQTEREANRAEVRKLIHEMDDVLEKFSRVVARQAMRRKREMDEHLEEKTEAAQAAQVAPGSTAPLGSKEYKDQLRRRIGGAALTVHREAQ